MSTLSYISTLFRKSLFGVGCLFLLFYSDSLLAQVPPLATDSTYVIQMMGKVDEIEGPEKIRDYLEGMLQLSRDLNYNEGIIESLRQLSALELEQGNISGGLRYSLAILNHFEKQTDSLALFDAYQKTGRIYQQEGLHVKALEYYKKAWSTKDQHTVQQQSQLEQQIGHTFSLTGTPDSSMIYFQSVLNYFESLNDTARMIRSYQDLAEVYFQQKDYQQLLDCNFKILDLITPSATPQKMATVYNNIGYSYNFLEDYKTAVQYFLKTLLICKQKDYIDLSVLQTNLGIAYNNMGKSQNAIKHFLEALKKLNRDNQKDRIYLNNLIANAYYNSGDLYNAVQYNEIAIDLAKNKRQVALLSEAYRTGATIHRGLYDFEQALDFYTRHLELRDSINFEERLRQQELLQQQFLLERSEKEIQLLLVNQEIADLTIGQLELEKEKFKLSSDKLQLESDNLKLEAKQKEDELVLLRNNQEIEKANLRNQELENQRVQQELAISQQRLLAVNQQNELEKLQQTEELQRLELARQEAVQKEKEREIDNLTKEQEISRLELERQEQFRQFVYGLGALTALILLMILSGLIYFRKANRRLAQQKEEIELQKEEIELERNKSERLLLNILPAKTAHELKNNGVATPRQHPLVSVLFTDFSHFTQISQDMTPEELIEELSICFGTFDEIIERHGLEKIKTIGDSYMCAGGIPTDNETNPNDAVAAAIEMQEYMHQRYLEKDKAGIPYWKMRVGIHTGEVIAGVVGSKKFAYDIWGDTVNTASRLESSGVEGRVNISEDTFHHVQSSYACQFRGKIDAKHKGKIGMYFVEGKKV